MRSFNLYKTEEFLKMLNLSGNEVIADIGGGTGYIAKILSDYFKKVYVLDHSSKMLSKVKRSSRVEPVCRDLFSSGFESGYFDVIILSDILHHIKDQPALLFEMKRICKPGGRILVQDFDIMFLKSRILMLFERVLFGRLYFKTRQYFDMIFAEHNFIKEKELVTNFNYIQAWRK